MKRSISNNKKSPINNNENEIDVNILLNDPKSLHKMLNKKLDDNGYVPTNESSNKFSNYKGKTARERTPYYNDGTWGGKPPRRGQYFELGNIIHRSQRKHDARVKEDFEKFKAMLPIKHEEEIIKTDVMPPLAFFKTPKEKDDRSPLQYFKEEGSKMFRNFPKEEKEEYDDIPEFARYSKNKYTDKREHTKAGELLNKGIHSVQDNVYDTAVKGYDKGKELISDFIKDSKKDGIGETLRKGVGKTEKLIINFIKNNKTLQKVEEKLGPINAYMRSIDPSYPNSRKDAELKKKNNR